MGEVFAGRYELADPIGRGGAGAVWRAWDHRRRRYVAAKVLLQSDAHALLRFVREQALRIDHPHVLAPASWAADDDKVLFTMDLVAGGSLVHLVGDYGPLPPRYVAGLLDQLLSGLAAVHAEGVVHRDVKPANILLEATGTGRPHLRLSDFGIALRKGDARLTSTDLVVGTPGYLAPELSAYDEPDFPVDLYATGLVALYLLQGAKPDAEALAELFRSQGTPHAPCTVPEPLWQVLAGLLQPDPHARFRTATGARKALAEAVRLLPEPTPDDELIEIFDQLGPLPPGFGPDGPATKGPDPDGRVAKGPDPDGGPPETVSGPDGGPPAEVRGHDGGSPPEFPGPEGPVAEVAGSHGPLPADSGPEVQLPHARSGADGPHTAGSTPGDLLAAGFAPGGSLPADPRPHSPLSTGPAPDGSFTAASAPDSAHAAGLGSEGGPLTADPGSGGRHRSVPSPDDSLAAGFPSDSSLPTPTAVPAPPPVPPAVPQAPAPAPAWVPSADRTTTHPYVPSASPAPPRPSVPRHSAPGQLHPGRPAAVKRSGPPAKVAVPVLLLAALCFAVGFWALGQT